MGLLKSLRHDPETARQFARCVADEQPYRLLDLKLYLTRRCNLRCIMCNSWTGNQDGQGELSTPEVFQLIKQAHALGLATLKLFGGEPSLRPDLAAIVAHASGLGVHCTLISNGTLLSSARAHALVEAGLAELDLSLDASQPELHDAIRGQPGAWQHAVQGLQHVQAAAGALERHVAIRVNAVVMRPNYRDLPKLFELLATLSVDEVTLNPVTPQDDNQRATAAHYILSRQDIDCYNQDIAPRLLEHASAQRPSRAPDYVYLYGTSQQDIEHASRGQYVKRLGVEHCFKPWYYAVVRENGDVLGCNTVKHPAARIGNVRQTPLAELWTSPAYRAFRASCKPPQFAECSTRCCYTYALFNTHIERALKRSANSLQPSA